MGSCQVRNMPSASERTLMYPIGVVGLTFLYVRFRSHSFSRSVKYEPENLRASRFPQSLIKLPHCKLRYAFERCRTIAIKFSRREKSLSFSLRRVGFFFAIYEHFSRRDDTDDNSACDERFRACTAGRRTLGQCIETLGVR